MKSWPWILLLPAIALGSGCQSGGSTELLELENRMLEDQLFQLQGELDEAYQMLARCDDENTRLRQDQGARPAETRSPTKARPPRSRAPADDDGPPDLQPPAVDLGEAEEEVLEEEEEADEEDGSQPGNNRSSWQPFDGPRHAGYEADPSSKPLPSARRPAWSPYR